MEVTLTEHQNKLIDKIAEENGFGAYEIATNPGSQKGDNFLGIVTSVTLQNGEKKLDLILKQAHQSEAFRKAAPLREAYLREIYLYENIFEEFDKYQKESKVRDLFTCYPKLFESSSEEGQECLIMGNLKTEGYQLWDKKLPMNSEHISAVLKEYAKFHAISLALNYKDPERFKKLTEEISKNIFENEDMMKNREKFDGYVKATLAGGYKAVEDDPELTEFLKNVERLFADFFLNKLRQDEYKQVVTHGDCWCNNLLFKYDDNNNTTKPSSIKILDWQIASLSSPAYDFCYFFLAHSPKEILDDYKTYLKLYYDTLSNQLEDFGYDSGEIFSYSRFEEHVKVYMIFGFYMCLLVFKIMLAESEEAPDFAEISEENGDIFAGMDFKVKNFEGFKKRIRDVIVFMRKNDFVLQ